MSEIEQYEFDARGQRIEEMREVISASLADTTRLDRLETLPFMVILSYNHFLPRVDGAVPLRSQIDRFLATVDERKP